ncbi:hypothetical protein FACS189413_17460 [Bacteroidia bacterium]|nr:hypothetical protein FACS189413_17460 [Bacteroidia bacterium]
MQSEFFIKRKNYGNSDIKKKTYKPVSNPARERVFVDIPQRDIKFFQFFADKMGWEVETKEDLLDRFIATRPTDVPLTDDDIMDLVREAH